MNARDGSDRLALASGNEQAARIGDAELRPAVDDGSYGVDLGAAGEVKTKPTQHSVIELRRIGMQPDILVCRTERDLSADIKSKIALFCSVDIAIFSFILSTAVHRASIDSTCTAAKVSTSYGSISAAISMSSSDSIFLMSSIS